MKRSFYFLLIFFSVLFSCSNEQKEDLNLKHLNYIAANINSDLIQIKNEILNLSSIIQYKIPFDREISNWPSDNYYFKNREVLSSKHENSSSAVYLPGQKEISSQLQKTIVNSELLDTIFKSSIERNALLSQVYFLDTNSFLRIYPFVDVYGYLKGSIDLREYVSYQTANNKPFLDDDVYWVNSPFADPYGRGWIIACVEPLYYRERFIGIVSGDITLRSLKEKYFSSDTELMLLTDAEGKLICCTRQAAKIIDIPVLREFQYFKPVTEDIFRFNNPSLTLHKNTGLRKAIKSLLMGENKEVFYVDNKKCTIYKSYIKETNWVLFKVIN